MENDSSRRGKAECVIVREPTLHTKDLLANAYKNEEIKRRAEIKPVNISKGDKEEMDVARSRT